MSDKKSLVQLVGDMGDLKTFVAQDEFLQIVNQEPPAKFIRNHPLASGVKYIPIEIIEMMLTKLFQRWRVEVLREGQVLNAVKVTVRLHYLHPITKEWDFQDGIGAVAIQVDKGKNASDLGAIKANAIMLGLPAAKSFAIKDAAEHIGKVFGRDLNRKEAIAFDPSYAGRDESINYTETNQTILVAQVKELLELTQEASGLKNEEEVKQWFREVAGMEMHQTKKHEFEAVKKYIEEQSIVRDAL